jgi:hypothetical protein
MEPNGGVTPGSWAYIVGLLITSAFGFWQWYIKARSVDKVRQASVEVEKEKAEVEVKKIEVEAKQTEIEKVIVRYQQLIDRADRKHGDMEKKVDRLVQEYVAKIDRYQQDYSHTREELVKALQIQEHLKQENAELRELVQRQETDLQQLRERFEDRDNREVNQRRPLGE